MLDYETMIFLLNYETMTLRQLASLRNKIDKVINSRKKPIKKKESTIKFDKEFKLRIKKAYRGASASQLALAENLAEKTSSVIVPTKSQVYKYMDIEAMSEAITLMKAGKRIKIH